MKDQYENENTLYKDSKAYKIAMMWTLTFQVEGDDVN